MELATLTTRVGTIEKLGTGLGLLFLAALAWIFYNIYQPVKGLEKDAAVQTEILVDIRDDIRTLGDKLERVSEPERGPQAGQAQPVPR